MARLVFAICFLYGIQGFTVIPKEGRDYVSKRGVASSANDSEASPLHELKMTLRYSAASWNSKEEVIPPEFFDLPEDERQPNASREADLSIEDIYGPNQGVPDYGNLVEDDDSYPDEV